MSQSQSDQSRGRVGAVVAAWRRRVLAAGLLALVPVLGACEADSFFDPSVVGRWEHTPTVVPILERIASVERGDDDFVDTTEVMPEDLIPVAAEPILGPGDTIDIRVRDYFRVGAEDQFAQVVDKRGHILIPRLPPIPVQGLTLTQARDLIVQTIQQEGLLNDPVVTIIPITVRQNTFSAFGAVAQPGTYFIPNADYRLLEALTAAGGWSETVPEVFVIRQVALSERVTGAAAPLPGARPAGAPAGGPAGQPQRPEELIDLIDELSRPPAGGAPSPGMVGGELALRRQPTGQEAPPPIDLPDAARRRAPEGMGQPAGRPGFNWVFLNGEWVRVSQPADGAGADGADGLDPEQLVTQRVIRIPMAQLIAGSRRYNIIIRPGDIIRVPVLGQGIVYLGGNVARPGTYGIPATGRLTLMRAIDAAGGLNQVAIPERVDITRMVGPNSQAMVRVNLKAINEGTQPDLFLKPDDRINVGTNFWAYPLAVIRGGFRASYGFGFLLDRNFGNDVFGAPPAERLQ